MASYPFNFKEKKNMDEYSVIPYNLSLENDFIKAYQEVYEDEPYNEFFSVEEVIEVAKRTELFLLIDSRKELIGFVGGKTLEGYFQENPKERTRLEGVLAKKIKTCYIAELGILRSKQRNGLGSFLFESFLKILMDKKYKQFILITAEANIKAQRLYEKTGFQKLKDAKGNILYREVSQLRISGKKEIENRPYYVMQCK